MHNILKLNCTKNDAISQALKKWITAALVISGLITSIHASAQTIADVGSAQAAPANIAQANAEFPGGIEKFYAYILSKVSPDSTCSPGKKIYVQFMIDKQGNVCHAKVRGHFVSRKMNAQLVKVFEGAPKWTPARQNGSDIREHFVCPVIFMPKADMVAANNIKH